MIICSVIYCSAIASDTKTLVDAMTERVVSFGAYAVKICSFLFIVQYSLAKDFFPDKKSVITNENLAFYERDDFYLITVPCATAALFLVCCVLCCTLYAREGICHLFDVPDELRRHASGEHFLTVDEFLELERRHRLGLPVDSLLELQEKRRSEAEAGLLQASTNNTAVQEYGEQPQVDTQVAGFPDGAPEYDTYDMTDQSAAKLASSFADMRSAHAQWSAPRTRRSRSLDRSVARDVDGFGKRPGQDIVPQDTPASPDTSPLRYDAPSSRQGNVHPKQSPPADRRDQDRSGQYRADRSSVESTPVPLSTAEDIKRIPTEDSEYPAKSQWLSQPQDGAGADHRFLHQSDHELSHHTTGRGYGAERFAGGSIRPTDDYGQRSSSGRPFEGALPQPEAHRRPLMASPVDQRDLRDMLHSHIDRSPQGPGTDRKSVDRHRAVDERRYSGKRHHGSASASALTGHRVPSIDGAVVTSSGARVHHRGYEPERLLPARDQVHPQKGGQEVPRGDDREDLQRAVRENLRRGENPPESLPRQPEQPLQWRTAKPYEHTPAAVHPDENRYPNYDLQQRTPASEQLTYNGYDYPPQNHDPQRYEHISRNAEIRAYGESRELPGAQRYPSESRGLSRLQSSGSQEYDLRHEQPVERRTSRVYDGVIQDYSRRSDTINNGYMPGDISPRTPSQLPLSMQRPSRSFQSERDATDFRAADINVGRGEPSTSDFTGHQQAAGADFGESRQWITGADGRQYLVTIQSRQSITAPTTPEYWPAPESAQKYLRSDVPEGSRIFSNAKIPTGIYGEAVDQMDLQGQEYIGRHPQQLYQNKVAEDTRRYEAEHRSMDNEKNKLDYPYGRGQDSRDEQKPSTRPSGLMQRVRSVSVSRMSHSLRQMVAGRGRPDSRSRSEEPRDQAGDSPRGSAAWLLHRIRSLRGVSEQPTTSAGNSQRRRQERRSDRRRRSHRHQDSPVASDGGVSGAADWPSSGEDLEEGEYVSPSRRHGDEGSRRPTPHSDGHAEVIGEEISATESCKQSPKQTAKDGTSGPSDNVIPERQLSAEEEPVQYILMEHKGRKRIISVTSDRLGVDHYPTSKALEPPAAEKRAASDLSEQSDEEILRRKSRKKHRDKSNTKHQRSDESVKGPTKRKKAKTKKKKKKRSRKRSRSSRSPSSSSSSSCETSTKKSKRRTASPCGDNDQSDSEEADYTDESSERLYDERQTKTDVASGKHFPGSASRENHRYVEQRRHQDQKDSMSSQRTSYPQRPWRPRRGFYHHRYQPRQSPVEVRSRWDSESPEPESPRTPPDREPTPERGRSELNRYGQPRHRPVVFQNESLRAFVNKPSRRALGQRGRPPRTWRGGLLGALRRPFQTNQSFMPWQQYRDSPQRGWARSTSPRRPGPHTPPPPAPSPSRHEHGRASPSTTPPRPPPPSSTARMDPRTRPAPRDPRLCARIQADRAAAAARESQIRKIVHEEMSQEDEGCATKLKRLFDK